MAMIDPIAGGVVAEERRWALDGVYWEKPDAVQFDLVLDNQQFDREEARPFDRSPGVFHDELGSEVAPPQAR
jgi:hypothetical protein